MPVYPGRRKGTWRVVVHARGKPHEEIVEGRKRDAQAIESQMRIALRAKPVSQTRAAPTFYDFSIESYEPHARANLKESTWTRMRRYQVADLSGFFGSTRVDSITEAMIDAYKAHCAARGFSPGYTNAMLVALQAMLRWGREGQGLPIPAIKIRLLKLGQRRVRAWTHEEVRRLYAAAAKLSPWFCPMLHFLLDTGCRKGESIAAEWSWVDLEKQMLRIPATAEWQPKDKAAREVPISDALRETLRARPRSARHVFLNQFGVPYTYFPHFTYWSARDLAGLTGGVHQTRHTFASHFLMGQPDLGLLASVMGHSTTYVTELYAHMLPEHLERARNVVQLAPPSGAWAKTVAATVAKGRRPAKSSGK